MNATPSVRNNRSTSFKGSRVFLASFFLAVGPVAGTAAELGCEHTGDPVAIEAVAAQRTRFNEAIAEGNIGPIDEILHPEVILITGTDSDVFTGAEAQSKLWQDDFSRPERAVYMRTPRCIRASAMAPVALEYGHWRGQREDGAFAAGSYAAKWRRVAQAWLLESEIFATESCSGDFCPENPNENITP